MAKYQQGFPVNENGEIVVSSGNGGNTVSSTLPIDQIPVDDTTGGLKLANVAMLVTDGGGHQTLAHGGAIGVLLKNDGSAASAQSNTELLQDEVDKCSGGKLTIAGGQGVVEISGTIYHDCIIDIGAGTTLKLRSGSTCSMFRNKSWNPSRTSVTGMTASGRTGVINVGTNHSFVTGQHISVLGFTVTGYNGVHPITGVTATTITVRLPRTPLVTTATGAGTISVVDDVVGLIGLGCVDYNEQGQAADGTMNTIQTVWANVANVYIGNGLTVKNAKKFNFLVAGYKFADVDDLRADTASDIIHFLGPGTYTKCTNISGKAGDDALAFTIGDVSWFNISRGDFFNITVDGLHVDSLQAMVRISGNDGWKFYDVNIANVYGSSAAAPITIADYQTDLLATAFDHIKINGVNVETVTQVPVVSYHTTQTAVSGTLDVEVDCLPSNAEGLSVSGATTTLRRANVEVRNPIDGCTRGAVSIGSGATVTGLNINRLRASYGSNTFAVWIVGTAQEIMVNDCEISGSGSRVVAQQGISGRIMLHNIRHSSGYRTFEQSSAANAGITVMMSNVRANSITNLAHFEKSATLLTSNSEIASGGATAAISANGATTVVGWSGDARLNGVTESALAGGATLTKTSSVVA